MPRFACAGLCLLLSASAHAQSDPIADRKNVMREISAASRDGAAIAKGAGPFDPAKARAVFTTYRDATRRFAAAFPESSKGGNTRASPRIWQDAAGFEAAVAKFVADAAAGEAASGTLAGFQRAFGTATEHCAACHEPYRTAR